MDESENLARILELQQKAREEYEALQRKHSETQNKCDLLEQERDEALHKLQHFHKVSEQVLEEVGHIQRNLQIQTSCRETAEAVATKLSRQNRSLKRRSMMLVSHLSPDLVSHIDLLEPDPDQDADQDPDQDQDLDQDPDQDPDLDTRGPRLDQGLNQVCQSVTCQRTIADLQSEKTRVETEVQDLREELHRTRDELLKEKHDNTLLIAEKVRLSKLLNSYNRVSLLALEEFEELQTDLDLEKNLRSEAESFAREMLIEQKKLKRQSQILVQNLSPDRVLVEALDQVQKLTGDLERERLRHREELESLQRCSSCSEQQGELQSLRSREELWEQKKKELHKLWSDARDEAKDLRATVEELQKKLQTLMNPAPPPAPPPPPPPPPPAPPAVSPLSSLLSLMRKKKDVSADIALTEKEPAEKTDVRQAAVDEMMQRIKQGVQLRPVDQSPSRTRRQLEKKPSNSAIHELRGITENFKRSPRTLVRAESRDRDSELNRVLLKRRDAIETQNCNSTAQSQI